MKVVKGRVTIQGTQFIFIPYDIIFASITPKHVIRNVYRVSKNLTVDFQRKIQNKALAGACHEVGGGESFRARKKVEN